jgi:hypothetical protein
MQIQFEFLKSVKFQFNAGPGRNFLYVRVSPKKDVIQVIWYEAVRLSMQLL